MKSRFRNYALLLCVCLSFVGCLSESDVSEEESVVQMEQSTDLDSLIVEKAEALAEEGTFEKGDIYVDTIHYGKYSQTKEEEMLALCKFKNNVHVAGMDRTLAIIFAADTMEVIAYKNFGADEVNLQCVPTDGVTEILYEGSTTYQDITTEYKELYTIQGNEWVEIPLEDAEVQEKYILAKEEVMVMRAKVLEGMTEAEIDRLKENIKVANQTMEKAYLYDDLFGRLSDSSNLYWNYIDQNGEIQIGWELEDVADYDAASGLSYDEYAEMHGNPVTAYNRFDADNFIALMEEMRDSLKVELLKADFDDLIENMQSAKETHDVKYIKEIYYILHDMDYFLLRYGIEDVGNYIDDLSTVSKYYGVLNIYELEYSTISGSVELNENIETTDVQEADYTVATAGDFTTSEVEQFAAEIRTNILEADWEALAEKLAYPITVNGNMLLDSSDFWGINIDKILCQDFVDAIEAEDCRQMFCNWQGISMGDAGQVWIGCVVEDNRDVQMKVLALNGMLELPEEELMIHRFYERFYDGELTYEKMNEILDGRGGCYQESCYYEDITYYWEVICGTTDVSNLTDPLFYTDMKYYTAEELAHATPTAIHLAKNEIYAKHGYIFKSEDLNNYFLGCTWYTPTCTAEEFDASVFNDFEQKNLELLAEMDEKGFHDMISSANQTETENAVTEDSFYNADEYGSTEIREQHYSNSQGQEGYYYTVDCFYLNDETNTEKYALVNQTLQKIYDEKEEQYQAYCAEQIEDYESDDNITNELQRINYVSWYLVNIPYIGDDYVSILFNDIEYYAGAAHPLTYFSPVTISVKTGEIVTPEEVLGRSWTEICEVVGMNVQNEVKFMEEYGFFLTDHTLTYKYRTNVFVNEIVVKR